MGLVATRAVGARLLPEELHAVLAAVEERAVFVLWTLPRVDEHSAVGVERAPVLGPSVCTCQSQHRVRRQSTSWKSMTKFRCTCCGRRKKTEKCKRILAGASNITAACCARTRRWWFASGESRWSQTLATTRHRSPAGSQRCRRARGQLSEQQANARHCPYCLHPAQTRAVAPPPHGWEPPLQV